MFINARSPSFLPDLDFIAADSISLARASLAIGENRGRVAIKGRVDQFVHAAAREDIVLPCAFIEHSIECELFACIARQAQDQVDVIDALHHGLALRLMLQKRSAPYGDLNSLAALATGLRAAIIYICCAVEAISGRLSLDKCSRPFAFTTCSCGSLPCAIGPWLPRVFRGL